MGWNDGIGGAEGRAGLYNAPQTISCDNRGMVAAAAAACMYVCTGRRTVIHMTYPAQAGRAGQKRAANTINRILLCPPVNL